MSQIQNLPHNIPNWKPSFLCIYFKTWAYSGTVFIPQIHIMTSRLTLWSHINNQDAHPVSVFPPFLPPKHPKTTAWWFFAPRKHKVGTIIQSYPIYILSIYSSPSSMIATCFFGNHRPAPTRGSRLPTPRLDFSPGYSAGRCLRSHSRSRPGAAAGPEELEGRWKDLKRELELFWNNLIFIYLYMCVCGSICIIYIYVYIYIWYINIWKILNYSNDIVSKVGNKYGMIWRCEPHVSQKSPESDFLAMVVAAVRPFIWATKIGLVGQQTMLKKKKHGTEVSQYPGILQTQLHNLIWPGDRWLGVEGQLMGNISSFFTGLHRKMHVKTHLKSLTSLTIKWSCSPLID